MTSWWKDPLCLSWHWQVIADTTVDSPITNKGFIVEHIQHVLIVFNWRHELGRLLFHRQRSTRVWQWCHLPR
jgi:hypothetical protein